MNRFTPVPVHSAIGLRARALPREFAAPLALRRRKDYRLVGQLGVVTGAKSGIGAATCALLSSLKARVVAADLAFEDTRCVLPGIGETVNVKLDVRDAGQVKALFRELAPISFLVNCAGAGIFKPVPDLSDEEWRLVIDTNLTGSFFCIREGIAAMLPAGGRIVNLGSISGRTALPGNGAYGASKCALRMLNAIVNEDMWARNIRATCLTLGAVATPIWESRPEFNPDDMLAPQAVAEVIASVLQTPLNVRLDEITICPPKGVL